MDVNANLVKELRTATGAGVMDCKRALAESDGNLETAVEYLRKKGQADAQKRAGRTTAEGQVGAYIHSGGKVGVLMEVNCETDFVARTADFQALTRDLAMQVAAMSPRFVSRDEVDDATLAKEREILRAQALEEGKPENLVDRIVQGRLDKFYGEACLLEQVFVKDDARKKTVREVVDEARAKLGENIRVRRFVRFQLGE
jgi:elongation factor Ts